MGERRLWMDAELAYACSVSWDLGRRYERERIAAATAELDARWRTAGRKAYEERVAERIALFEMCAARVADRYGRPAGYAYRGGPVDWETGRPVRHLEAVA